MKKKEERRKGLQITLVKNWGREGSRGGCCVVWLLQLLISDASQPPLVQCCSPSPTASPTPDQHPQPSHPAHFLLYLSSPLPRLRRLCLPETMTASCVRQCGCLSLYFDTTWLKIFVFFFSLWGKPKREVVCSVHSICSTENTTGSKF